MDELGAVVHIGIGVGSVCPFGSQAVCAVGEAPGGGAGVQGVKLPAVLPGKPPVTNHQGIAGAKETTNRPLVPVSLSFCRTA